MYRVTFLSTIKPTKLKQVPHNVKLQVGLQRTFILVIARAC